MVSTYTKQIEGKRNWMLHHHPNYLASNGFWFKEKSGFCNHDGFLSLPVIIESWLHSSASEQIIIAIGTWGMAVRCWGTKRLQEDMGDYQPSSLSLQIRDKGFASRKEARTLKRFLSKTFSDMRKHTKKIQTHISQAQQHICCLSAHLPTCLNVSLWINSKKYCIYFFKTSVRIHYIYKKRGYNNASNQIR